MKANKTAQKRSVRVCFSCSAQEYEAIMALAHRTTTRNFSGYARNMLLRKPVATSYHDHSLDAIVVCMGGLRGQLERLMERPDLGSTERSQLAQLMSEINSTASKILESCMRR